MGCSSTTGRSAWPPGGGRTGSRAARSNASTAGRRAVARERGRLPHGQEHVRRRATGRGAKKPAWNGWWGDDPPFQVPVVVLTNHSREPVSFANGTSYVFVTDGIEAALARAEELAAGGKALSIAGGASVVQQYLAAGPRRTEIGLSVAPVLLGGGTWLLDGLPQMASSSSSRRSMPPGVAHLRYRVKR